MRLSDNKKNKIAEQILSLLYLQSPKALFTSHVAKELARDEEFIKQILLDLEKKNILLRIGKNSNGINYIKRIRWRLSPGVYNIYKQKQGTL